MSQPTVWKADYDAKCRELRRTKEELEYAVSVLTFLSNTHTTCRCNTIANPCPHCRVRVALQWISDRQKDELDRIIKERS